MRQNKKLFTLLDIDSYSGLSNDGAKEWLILIVLSLIIFFGSLNILGAFGVPKIIIFMLDAIIIFRLMLFIPLKENKRLKVYKDSFLKKYQMGSFLIQIATTLKDGRTDYTYGGRSSYTLALEHKSYNPDVNSEIVLAKTLFNDIMTRYETDIRCIMVDTAEALSDRYRNVTKFKNEDLIKLRVDYLDYNISYAKSNTRALLTFFTVYFNTSDKKEVKNLLESKVNRIASKNFQDIRILNSEEISSLVSRDIGMKIDFERINNDKYFTGEYYGSRVIKDEEEIDASSNLE